jgi:Ca-activated chloride channel family protein
MSERTIHAFRDALFRTYNIQARFALYLPAVALVLLIIIHLPVTAQNNSAADKRDRMSKNFRAAEPDEDLLRTKTRLVTLDVSVTDAANIPIGGLTRDNFIVLEDKIQQQIEYFRESDEPASIAILIDTSSSMQGNERRTQETLHQFIQLSHPSDEYFLLTFNTRTSIVTENADAEEISRHLSLVHTDGNTALYDGVAKGIEKLSQSRHRKRALLIVSDGEDNASRTSWKDLKERIREAGVMIYAVSLTGEFCGPVCRRIGFLTLRPLTEMTGGKAFFPDKPADFEEAFAQIATTLRRQYSIGYSPGNEDFNGKWRKVKVRVQNTHDRVVVRTRDGYYATGEEKPKVVKK